jgi:helicase
MDDKKLIRQTLEISGFKQLNPVQKQAIKKDLFKRKNLVVAAPTASGKTLIAELAALKTILEKKEKIIYMVPLVALAAEKFRDFKQKYEQLGVRVAMSIGDYDSSDPWLANYDLIVVSNEKMDSLIRHGVEWVKNVGLVVTDEIHMLNEISRGPTLEITLTRLREIIPNAQILALSATIKNAEELAEWLQAKTIISEWRPVKLYAGASFDSKIKFLEKKDYELNPSLSQEAGIIENTLGLKKQALFFVMTRRNAESLAERLGKIVRGRLKRTEVNELKKLSEEIKNVLEVPTRQCRRLANCVKNGTAFHHAGLLYKQKSLLEEIFRNGLIKTIVATPTLAYGVNLPAFRVIIRDLRRYYPGRGAIFIPILEVHQMLGRCGRPTYDKFGEGILSTKSEEEAEELIENYIFGEPEEISSKLAVEPVLRMHTLALIASEFCKSEKSLLEFFSKTFFTFQYGSISAIEKKVLEILDKLIKWKFIQEKGKKLFATRLGKRISELYIDPLTARHFIQCLGKTIKKKTESFSFLQAISNTLEMRPLLRVGTGDFSELEERIAEKENILLKKVPVEWDLDFDNFLRSIKTTLMFESWINEATEDQILTKYKVAPGELRGRLRIGDWLIYCLQELGLLLGYKKILRDIRKTRVRLRHGVREELIPLVRLKDIGRVRGRKLFSAGLTSLQKLRKIPLESLSRFIGPKVAYSIKEQLGQVKKKKQERQKTLKTS